MKNIAFRNHRKKAWKGWEVGLSTLVLKRKVVSHNLTSRWQEGCFGGICNVSLGGDLTENGEKVDSFLKEAVN